jgi:hypothetical protein
MTTISKRLIMKHSSDRFEATPQIRIAHGPLAVEALLLEDLQALLQAACEDPGRLSQPVRVIVPSRSLRQHLGATLVRHLGRSVAGVLIQTLHGAAREIIERAGEVYPGGRYAFEVLVRRHAREEAVLRDGLDHLVDGYATVAATVMDFVDSGLEPEHVEAMEERLAALRGETVSSGLVERATALVRVAARTIESMAMHGVGVPTSGLRMAIALLERNPDLVLPARAVLIHGFADATGVATDFLECLLRYRSSRIYWDQPPDPARASELDPGVRFTHRLFERLRGVSQALEPPHPSLPLPEIRTFRAPGAHSESREVARRIAGLLALGASPHRIGVVARDLTRYRIPLRLHFEQFGIPFSGAGSTAAPIDGRGRRIRALLELLRRQARTTTDQWLEALVVTRPFDLRLALHALGAGRISDVASLDPEAVLGHGDRYPLPVRRGLRGDDEDPEDRRGHDAPRRCLPGASLRRTIELARTLIRRWTTWPESASLHVHAERLRSLLIQALCWSPDAPGVGEVLQTLEDLSRDIPAGLSVSYEEFVLLLTHSLSGAGSPALGGQGGGVQVLNVMEARGRTFDHLFLMGLNRDIFPRTVREDPLLPDSIRRDLATLLPDFPIKGMAFDEERYLFAQLLSSSALVTLSWEVVDDEGGALSPSPLVERLRLSLGWEQTETIAPPYARPSPQGDSPGTPDALPAHDHAVIAGLHGSRAHFSRILPVAVAEARAGVGGNEDPWLQPESLARTRVAVLEEMDPDRRTPEGRARAASLGPYFGFVGPLTSGADPRHADLYISTLEGMATCPWQVFLRRLLRIQSMPDPLEALPDVDPSLLGITVHAVLEGVVRLALPGMPRTLSDAMTGGSVPVPWPEDANLERILSVEADRIIREAGIGLHGLVRVLETRARPYLQVARQTDWPDGQSGPRTLAAEVRGELIVDDHGGRPRSIHFMADRVDRSEDRLRFTDYKTGRTIRNAVKEETRRKHFLTAVRKGERLQAIAYVLASGGEPAEGRYVFLKPDIPEACRIFSIGHDEDFLDAFRTVIKNLLSALDRGVFFPRLVEPEGREEPRACAFCEVTQACLRGDSGARNRLITGIQRIRESIVEGRTPTDAEAALLGVWFMGAKHSDALKEQEEEPSGE